MTEAFESMRILVVDDDEIYRNRLVRAFSERGLVASGAKNGEEALTLAQATPPDMAVVDLRMPGMPGLEFVQALKTKAPNAKIVVLTGFGSIATALDAVRMGAQNYLTKPADTDEILAAFNTEGPASSPDSVPSLDRVEWEHIQRVLAEFNNNISQAAKALGIHRRTLQRKLSKHPPQH